MGHTVLVLFFSDTILYDDSNPFMWSFRTWSRVLTLVSNINDNITLRDGSTLIILSPYHKTCREDICGVTLCPYRDIVYVEHIPWKYILLWVTAGPITSACVFVLTVVWGPFQYPIRRLVNLLSLEAPRLIFKISYRFEIWSTPL